MIRAYVDFVLPQSQYEAIVRLLKDDDPQTVALVKEQLAENGSDALPQLRALMLVDDMRVAKHAREVASRIENLQAISDFTLLCHLFPETGDLENACWILARALIPGVDTDHYQHQLDVWGRRLVQMLPVHATDRTVIQNLNALLHTELGFRGNSDDYYNASNSLLPSVIDTRLGIPISLTLIYMFVAGRAGRKVEGVNLPGHFVAKVGETLFDPFNDGRVIRIEDCQAILAQQKLRFHDSYLDPAPHRMVLQRILANLLFIYEDSHDRLLHTRISGWLRCLERKQQ